MIAGDAVFAGVDSSVSRIRLAAINGRKNASISSVLQDASLSQARLVAGHSMTKAIAAQPLVAHPTLFGCFIRKDRDASC